MDPPYAAYAGPWLAMWECAAIWSRASMEATARMWGLSSPSRSDSLAALGLAMDRQMRNPAFLRLMRCSLQVASARSWVDLAHAFLGFPSSPLQGRVS